MIQTMLEHSKGVNINSKELAKLCARIADSKKGENIVILDVDELSSVASYFVICSGRIDKHVRAIADEIEDRLRAKKIYLFHSDRDQVTHWIVLDYLDVIVHVFDQEKRDYYRLESLWGDAEEIEWK